MTSKYDVTFDMVQSSRGLRRKTTRRRYHHRAHLPSFRDMTAKEASTVVELNWNGGRCSRGSTVQIGGLWSGMRVGGMPKR